jgi:hypothetical protein
MTASVLVELVGALVTIAISLGGSAFIAGTRWGEVQVKLTELERDKVTTTDVHAVTERLAKIEGMFTLKLRDSGS